jgi:ribonucleoside-diphosphate reductase alpha chain
LHVVHSVNENTLSPNAREVLERRYLARDEEGQITETPDDLWRRVAAAVAAAESRFGAEGEARRERYGKAFVELLASRSFLPNSPTLMNAGRPLAQLSACFVLPVLDSLHGIFDSLKHAALIHQSGGGTGFAFSRLRPRGAMVRSSSGVASGPVSFLRVYNGATEAIKQGGCVVADTRVATDRGLVQIRELGPETALAGSWYRRLDRLKVATDNSFQESDEFYHNGVAQVRRLRTRHGYAIAATPQHRLRVIDDQGQYVWRTLADIKIGDWVALQKGTCSDDEPCRLPAVTMNPHHNAQPIRIPDSATPELGEFVGYFLGDGAISRNRHGTARLILTVNRLESDIAARLLDIAESIFGLRASPQEKPGDGSINYFFSSTSLVQWLKGIGIEKPSSRDVRIPEIAFRAGRRFACALLRGLFSADGYVSKEGYPSLSSVSRALIDDAQQLLLWVGIPSSISVTTNRRGAFGRLPLNTLRVITRDGIKTFAETVGFMAASKQARLRGNLVKSYELSDVIPNQAGLLRTAYCGPGRGSAPGRKPRGANRPLYRAIQHYISGPGSRRHLSRSRLRRLATDHPAIAAQPRLSWLLSNSQFYDRVVEIENGEALTLDLSVPANNTYIANGFVSHNTRRGANMGILRVDHPDIREFIDVKNDPGELSNFNLSVGATDDFMAAVAAGDDFVLRDPQDGHVVETVEARALFERIVHNAWRTGDPGLVFLDRINAENPTPEQGPIEATNPCGEQPLLPYEACNLGSLNVARFANGRDVDWPRLAEAVALGIRFLDDVIDANRYPLPEIDAVVKRNRKVGLGIMGFADLLIEVGIAYDSEAGLAMGEKLMEFIQKEAEKATIQLAKERGPFPAFERSIYRQGPPRRNATVTTVAPTGTLAMIADCSSGIEPLFAVSYVKRVMDGRELVYIHPAFVRMARAQGFYSEELMRMVARTGGVQSLTEVPAAVRALFRTAYDIAPEWHVRMQAAFQRHTENAVSKTINFPRSADVGAVREAYLLAHELGLKGITVYRDGSRESQVLERGEGVAALIAGDAAAAATAEDEAADTHQEELMLHPLRPAFDRCPECGSPLVHREGCRSCLTCGLAMC